MSNSFVCQDCGELMPNSVCSAAFKERDDIVRFCLYCVPPFRSLRAGYEWAARMLLPRRECPDGKS